MGYNFYWEQIRWQSQHDTTTTTTQQQQQGNNYYVMFIYLLWDGSAHAVLVFDRCDNHIQGWCFRMFPKPIPVPNLSWCMYPVAHSKLPRNGHPNYRRTSVPSLQQNVCCISQLQTETNFPIGSCSLGSMNHNSLNYYTNINKNIATEIAWVQIRLCELSAAWR